MAFYRSMVAATLLRPIAWPALLGLARVSRSEGWWRRPPFLPLPPPEYLRWRAETAWGEPEAVGSDDAVVGYLRWASAMRRRHRGS